MVSFPRTPGRCCSQFEFAPKNLRKPAEEEPSHLHTALSAPRPVNAKRLIKRSNCRRACYGSRVRISRLISGLVDASQSEENKLRLATTRQWKPRELCVRRKKDG